MEFPLDVKGEQEIRLVDCLPPPCQHVFHTTVSFLLYLSCFISVPKGNVSMGKKETGNEVLL